MPKSVLKAETDTLNIELDQEKCISCGTCSVMAPKTFGQDGNYVTKLKENPKDPSNKILEAAQSCATEAIILTDKSTGKRLYPKK